MTRITHLSMTGFGVFDSAQGIAFPEGRIVILGRNEDSASADSNGAGKTTIFKGLSWCLYGETIDRLSEPDVIHKGAKKARVRVRFERGGQIFRVTRIRTPKTGKLTFEEMTPAPGSEVIQDLTQTSKAATQRAIIASLGLDWDAFRCTVLFGQGDHSRFASPTVGDAARKAVLSTVLRLGAYEEARVEAKLVESSARSKIMELEEAIRKGEKVVAGYEAEAALLTARADDARELMAKGDEDATKLEGGIAALEADLEILSDRLAEASVDRANAVEDGAGVEADRTKARDLRAERDRSRRQAAERARDLATEGPCSECGQPRPYDAVKHEAARAELAKAEAKFKSATLIKESVEQEAKEIREEIAGLDTKKLMAKRSMHSLEKEIAHRAGEAKSVRAQMAVAQEKADDADKRIEVIGTEIDFACSGLVKPRADIEVFKKRQRLARWWASGFGPKGAPAYAIEQCLPVLNQKANRHLLELSDGDIEVRWTATTTGSSGIEKEVLTQNVIIEGTEGAAPSGGQSKKMELATELALAELMLDVESVGMNILLLDEALDGLDAEGQRRVVEWVHTALPHETVFVVSHDDAIADSFEDQLVVIKNGGSSTLGWS